MREARNIPFDLAVWLAGAAALWLSLAVIMFHRGLRRYTSASS